MLVWKNLKHAKENTGLSYLGMVNNSTKHEKAYKYNEMVYTVYLAPANLSGYEVCSGRTPECSELCLNESGRNRINGDTNSINQSRIKKTRLFFENHQFFCNWIVDDIKRAKIKAEKQNFRFSVRINNTSDISPETIFIRENGIKKNILQLFPDVQFYDYTKIPSRIQLTKKYPNYDITFSYNGYNMEQCIQMLNNNIRVAMVFNKVPTEYNGFKVIDGDLYDLRYLDPKNVIVGLKFKKVRNKLTTENKFVIQ